MIYALLFAALLLIGLLPDKPKPPVREKEDWFV